VWALPVGDHVREREGSGRWRDCWAESRELGRGGKEGEKRMVGCAGFWAKLGQRR
jgi:hypothetical protein